MVQQDTHMMETELLEDFLFAESQQQQQQQQEQQEQQHQQPGSYGGGDGEEQHGDDLFSTFINTDMLLQPSNYTLQPQHTSSMMLGVDAPDLLNGFSEPRQPRKSISPLGGTSDIQSPAPSVSTGLTTPPQAMSYSQGCERLVDRSLQFGRTKPIQSAYLNSSDFLDIPEDTLPYKLVVSGMPSASRVETQIKLELSISPPPREYIVHLPTDCITKQKWYLEDDITTYPREIQNEILYLESFLVCASNGKPTYVCSRCVKREQRRASRRKSGLCDNMLWCNNENRRAVVFNSKQVFSIKDVNCTPQFKSFDLSTRIVCYCRHHKEPEGFKILFVLRNANQEVLAKSLTGPIMIMDKKSNRDAAANTSLQDSVADSNNNTDGSRSERSEIPNVTSTSDFSGMENHKPRDDFMHLSVKGEHMLSPTSMGGDSSEAHATDANVVESYGPRGAASSVSLPDKASGYKRKRSSPDYNSTAIGFSPQNFTKPHANSNFSKSLSASSSNHSIPLLNQPAHNNPTAAMMTATNSMLREISDMAEVPQAPRPYINRVIPSQGPVKGGIEVTLLGSNFKPGMIVKFGQNRALSTQCWSESTLVTYLPPSSRAQEVLVTVFEKEEEQPEVLGTMSNSKAIFTYVDDTDRQLIELALQIVGLKMNGKLEDARNIAKRIVGHEGNSSNSTPSPSANNAPQNSYNTGMGQVLYSDESLLLKVIKLLNSSSNLSMCDEEGQTMLHLACLKGYYHLASALVRKGARVDAKDSFGFLPLHFACLNGDARIIRLLVQCKATVHAETINGSSPRDLFIANHDTDDERYEDYLNEVLDALDTDSSSEEYSCNMLRKLSDSSFQSSVFDAESLASLNDNIQVHISKMAEDTLSDDDEDLDGYEEDGDECLLQDDDDSIATADNSQSQDSALITTSQEAHRHSGQFENSIWNRVLNAFNDDLPKYEDLFPVLDRERNKKSLLANRNPTELTATQSSTAEDSQTSSEDEEDALQARFNRFFQQRQNFRNDKMLLFFWLPVAIILLSSFLIFEFGHDGNRIHHLSQAVSEYLRVGLANVMLGNERVKGAFKGSLHSLQAGAAVAGGIEGS